MGDPISTQFGALEKLMKESAEADMRKQVALKRFQLGQAHAQVMARQEMEQMQAEQEGAAQGQSQQPTAPFQVDLPTNGALAERPVQWKNPLSQIVGNAYSAVAQAGAAGPGAAIQEQLRATAGAVPGGMDAMLQGLNVMGPTQTTTQTDVGVTPQAVGQQGYVMLPQANRRTTETPNALTAEDIAKLRAGLLDRMLAEQGRQKESGGFDANVFKEYLFKLNNDYGDSVPSTVKSQLAFAAATGDAATVQQLSAGLPDPQKPYDPIKRDALKTSFEKAEVALQDYDEKIGGLTLARQSMVNALNVLQTAQAETGYVRGSTLGQVYQRIAKQNPTALNVLNQAFGEEWTSAKQQMGSFGQLSDADSNRIDKTVGGMDKSIEFNIADLKNRIRVMDSAVKRHTLKRTLAARTRDAIIKEAKLSGIVEFTPEIETPELPQEEQAGALPQSAPVQSSDQRKTELLDRWAPK